MPPSETKKVVLRDNAAAKVVCLRGTNMAAGKYLFFGNGVIEFQIFAKAPQGGQTPVPFGSVGRM